MSREIKAPRVWYKPLGIMVQPDKVESINFETKTISVYMDMNGKGFHRLRLSDFEVMWQTSIKDRNGEEMYEGDILKWESNGIIVYSLITFQDGAYWSSDAPISDCLDEEIVGNIYQNPELLKEA